MGARTPCARLCFFLTDCRGDSPAGSATPPLSHSPLHPGPTPCSVHLMLQQLSPVEKDAAHSAFPIPRGGCLAVPAQPTREPAAREDASPLPQQESLGAGGRNSPNPAQCPWTRTLTHNLSPSGRVLSYGASSPPTYIRLYSTFRPLQGPRHRGFAVPSSSHLQILLCGYSSCPSSPLIHVKSCSVASAPVHHHL